MILADTSAWIEYLQGTGSPANQRLVKVIEEDEQLAVTEVVIMELLAGATDARRDALRRLLYRFELVPAAGSQPTRTPLSSTGAAAAMGRRHGG